MGKSKKEVGTSKQFRWTIQMERMLLEILVEETRKGNKSSNTFNTLARTRVAAAISERFKVECKPDHVDNHLKTIYLKYGQFLNKKLEMYDEMALVIGKDMATGSFVKSFADIDVEETYKVDSMPVGIETETNEEVIRKASSSNGTSQSRSNSKRKNVRESVEYEKLDYIVKQLGEIANAIKKFTEDQVSTAHLYEQVMSMEGFDEESLAAAFDHLVEHNKQAEAFMVKNKKLSRLWLEKYLKS